MGRRGDLGNQKIAIRRLGNKHLGAGDACTGTYVRFTRHCFEGSKTMEIQLPDDCQKLGIHLCDGDVPVVGSVAVADYLDKPHRNMLRGHCQVYVLGTRNGCIRYTDLRGFRPLLPA
jgi:hypothetical protein